MDRVINLIYEIGDLSTTKLSEVPWGGSSGNEKFYFDNLNVCIFQFNIFSLSNDNMMLFLLIPIIVLKNGQSSILF